MKTIFGIRGLAIAEYAIAANAVLGIRDSGKTYTATKASEELFDAGIPFIWLDPIGVAHNLRVPGRGKGYPVVVAGGKHGDLPLTTKNVGAIVRAAMESGVSLVLDLFSVELSKADWRKIVKETCEILLHENQEFGLRHVFVEEAAEFVPQKPQDMLVFSAVEKLVRMGGNSKVGITLINQRSADLNKSVLELCANVFVHRQRGKNTLLDLQKWLNLTDPLTQKKVLASLPDLESGHCWVMSNDLKIPALIVVPAKNSLHPDRRAPAPTKAEAARRKPVEAGAFVAAMKEKLEKKAPAPAKPAPHIDAKDGFKTVDVIRAGTVVMHTAEIQKQLAAAEARGRQAGWDQGFMAGHKEGFESGFHSYRFQAKEWTANVRPNYIAPVKTPSAPKAAALHINTAKQMGQTLAPVVKTMPLGVQASLAGLSKPQGKILDAMLAGHTSRQDIAEHATMDAAGGHFKTRLSELSSFGIIDYPDKDSAVLQDWVKA